MGLSSSFSIVFFFLPSTKKYSHDYESRACGLAEHHRRHGSGRPEPFPGRRTSVLTPEILSHAAGPDSSPGDAQTGRARKGLLVVPQADELLVLELSTKLDIQRVIKVPHKKELDFNFVCFDTEYFEGTFYVFDLLAFSNLSQTSLRQRLGVASLLVQQLSSVIPIKIKPFFSMDVLVSKAEKGSIFFDDLAEDLWPDVVNLRPETLIDDVSDELFDGLIFSFDKHFRSGEHVWYGDYKFKPKRKITVDVEFKEPDLCLVDGKLVGKLSTPIKDISSGLIIEVKFESQRLFKFLRRRDDKTKSNSLGVFQSNWNLWRLPKFDLEDLFKKPQRKRKSQYWQPQRSEDPSFVLQSIRDFHNKVVKKALFWSQRQGGGRASKPECCHLELGAGQGGDLSRILTLCRDDYRCVVFVDKDKASLAELKRRLRHFETNELEFVFLSLDLNLEASRLFDLNIKFKTISAQFCLHYFSRSWSTF